MIRAWSKSTNGPSSKAGAVVPVNAGAKPAAAPSTSKKPAKVDIAQALPILFDNVTKWESDEKVEAETTSLLQALSVEQQRLLVHVKDSHGQTLLHLACQHHVEFLVHLLLEWGADGSCRDGVWNATPLHLTAMSKHAASASIMQHLQEYADEDEGTGLDVNALDSAGCTALHYACYSGDADAVSWLLENGATPDVLNQDGNPPIHYARAKNAADCVELMEQALRPAPAPAAAAADTQLVTPRSQLTVSTTPATMKRSQVPPGWQRYVDEESGWAYYANPVTGESVWEAVDDLPSPTKGPPTSSAWTSSRSINVPTTSPIPSGGVGTQSAAISPLKHQNSWLAVATNSQTAVTPTPANVSIAAASPLPFASLQLVPRPATATSTAVGVTSRTEGKTEAGSESEEGDDDDEDEEEEDSEGEDTTSAPTNTNRASEVGGDANAAAYDSAAIPTDTDSGDSDIHGPSDVPVSPRHAHTSQHQQQQAATAVKDRGMRTDTRQTQSAATLPPRPASAKASRTDQRGMLPTASGRPASAVARPTPMMAPGTDPRFAADPRMSDPQAWSQHTAGPSPQAWGSPAYMNPAMMGNWPYMMQQMGMPMAGWPMGPDYAQPYGGMMNEAMFSPEHRRSRRSGPHSPGGGHYRRQPQRSPVYMSSDDHMQYNDSSGSGSDSPDDASRPVRPAQSSSASKPRQRSSNINKGTTSPPARTSAAKPARGQPGDTSPIVRHRRGKQVARIFQLLATWRRVASRVGVLAVIIKRTTRLRGDKLRRATLRACIHRQMPRTTKQLMSLWRQAAWRVGTARVRALKARSFRLFVRDLQRSTFNPRNWQVLTATLEDKNREIEALKAQAQDDRRVHYDALTQAKIMADRQAAVAGDLAQKVSELQSQITSLLLTQRRLVAFASREQEARRFMHESLQQQLGSLRCVVRVRPMLSTELNAGYRSVVDIRGARVDIHRIGKPSKSMQFDTAFPTGAPQRALFTALEPLVQSVIDSVNVGVFVYGHTNSGKSFTLVGPADMPTRGRAIDEAASGLLPRVAHELFRLLSVQRLPLDTASAAAAATVDASTGQTERSSLDLSVSSAAPPLPPSTPTSSDAVPTEPRWNAHAHLEPPASVRVRVSMLDIRGQYVNDLLRSPDHPAPPLALVPEKDGIMAIEGATIVDVSSPAEFLTTVFAGLRRTHPISPFRHTLTSILVEHRDSHGSVIRRGKMTLVDLAGSERMEDGVVLSDPARNEYEQAVTALHGLGEVFAGVASGSQHVPYNSHVLTKLTRDVVGGNAKTLVCFCLSPCESDENEALRTLKFASHVMSTDAPPVPAVKVVAKKVRPAQR